MKVVHEAQKERKGKEKKGEERKGKEKRKGWMEERKEGLKEPCQGKVGRTEGSASRKQDGKMSATKGIGGGKKETPVRNVPRPLPYLLWPLPS
jgi:hypothetical protein